jgi:hypothetical protein
MPANVAKNIRGTAGANILSDSVDRIPRGRSAVFCVENAYRDAARADWVHKNASVRGQKVAPPRRAGPTIRSYESEELQRKTPRSNLVKVIFL